MYQYWTLSCPASQPTQQHPLEIPSIRPRTPSPAPIPMHAGGFRQFSIPESHQFHHLLKHGLCIEHYNNVWFDGSVKQTNQQPMRPHPASTPAPSTSLPGHPHTLPATLLATVLARTDKLFLVAYQATGTLRHQWSLVQINLPCSKCDPNSQA